MELSEDQLKKLFALINALALNCSDHMKNEHSQKSPNDKPRYYFDNIAKQTRDLRDEVFREP